MSTSAVLPAAFDDEYARPALLGNEGKTPSYHELQRRLELMCAAQDELEAKLRAGTINTTAAVLGMGMVRRAVGWGKPSDQIAASEFSFSSPKTIQRARKQLQQVGFYAQIDTHGGHRWGPSHLLNIDAIAQARPRRRQRKSSKLTGLPSQSCPSQDRTDLSGQQSASRKGIQNALASERAQGHHQQKKQLNASQTRPPARGFSITKEETHTPYNSTLGAWITEQTGCWLSTGHLIGSRLQSLKWQTDAGETAATDDLIKRWVDEWMRKRGSKVDDPGAVLGKRCPDGTIGAERDFTDWIALNRGNSGFETILREHAFRQRFENRAHRSSEELMPETLLPPTAKSTPVHTPKIVGDTLESRCGDQSGSRLVATPSPPLSAARQTNAERRTAIEALSVELETEMPELRQWRTGALACNSVRSCPTPITAGTTTDALTPADHPEASLAARTHDHGEFERVPRPVCGLTTRSRTTPIGEVAAALLRAWGIPAPD